jgi:hypothetical protein
VWVKTDRHKGLWDERRAGSSEDYKRKKMYVVCHKRGNFREEVATKKRL